MLEGVSLALQLPLRGFEGALHGQSPLVAPSKPRRGTALRGQSRLRQSPLRHCTCSCPFETSKGHCTGWPWKPLAIEGCRGLCPCSARHCKCSATKETPRSAVVGPRGRGATLPQPLARAIEDGPTTARAQLRCFAHRGGGQSPPMPPARG